MLKKNIEKNNTHHNETFELEDTKKQLRQIAEKIVHEKSAKNKSTHHPLSLEASTRVIYELEVHQIELEMQNNELHRIQAELEKSGEWYMDLYDFAPVGYFTLSDKGFIIEANLTASILMGVKRKTISGQPFTQFIYSEDQDIYYLHQKNLFETGNKQLFELRLIKSDDTKIWVSMQTTLVYCVDGSFNCRAVISDITELKKLEQDKKNFEEKLILSQKLESLGVLAGGIAHNFNNLLAVIFGYVELASDKSGDPVILKYLTAALNMRDRAKKLTGHLLTFARGGTPAKKINPLFPFVQDCVQFALSGSNIASDFDIQENLWQCNFDSSQISQVIDNVILNARNAMPHGGTIDVTADNVSLNNNDIAGLPEGKHVKISIKDHGIGISPEVLSKIFDPFFTTGTAGSGLGLSTCYSIINRHDGIINIDSVQGQGTDVTIYLPAVSGISEKLIEKPDQEHKGFGTIILMDDEPYIRLSLSEILMSMGYEVILMEDGNGVLSYLNDKNNVKSEISGIILDLIIPGGMGGKAAVPGIQKIVPDVPVFAISGYSDDPIMENPQNYGFTASLSKPFGIDELSEMLSKYLLKGSS